MLTNLSENHQRLLGPKFSYQNHYYLFFWDHYGFIQKSHLQMTMIVKYQPPPQTNPRVIIYAQNLNILRYFSGMGGLAFSS